MQSVISSNSHQKTMRHVFFSFDWDDVWRVNQVRNSWVAKGNYTAAGFVDSAEIETLKRDTDLAIKRWIGKQMNGTSVTCVLIGSQTANSRWVKYEIEKSIEKGNGLLGVYIHNVKDMKCQRLFRPQFSKVKTSFFAEIREVLDTLTPNAGVFGDTPV